MTINRGLRFTLALGSAKALRMALPYLCPAFAATLRSVWLLVKAAVAGTACSGHKPLSPQPWERENPHRTSVVARRASRLGSDCGAAGWSPSLSPAGVFSRLGSDYGAAGWLP